ncbi:MAG: dihydrolipoamide acetyltransferase family protein [Anaerolineales bacterium]|nr:dihydrolipoamide acetyltransferase family protein [Anaerolineales bacterium]
MADVVTMPKLGFDMAEGTLVRWLIQEGQTIKKGAIIAEIETDKATVEVESNYDGVVARLLVPQGEIVPVNTPIAIIAAPGEKVEELPEAAGVVTEKAPAPPETSAEAKPADRSEAIKPAPGEAVEQGQLPGGVRASPLARRMAADMRINLQKVPGSGPGGRIVKRDIQAYLEAPAVQVAAPTPMAAPTPARAPLPPLAPLAAAPQPEDQIIPLNRLRAAIGRRMVESKQQAPHFYVTHEYDVGALIELRKQLNALLPDEEKLSVNDFIIKAAALTLRQFPNLNAAFQNDQIVHYGAVNIGVAVAVENGLLTVVCRDADRKPLRQIAIEVRTMSARAREGKVRSEDIEGSTFSTSNLGMFDVEHFVAIINPPEAAILAIGSAKQMPVVKDDQLAIGWRMKTTLSVDHRVSDGAEGARFLQAMAAYLEEPLRLLI